MQGAEFTGDLSRNRNVTNQMSGSGLREPLNFDDIWEPSWENMDIKKINSNATGENKMIIYECYAFYDLFFSDHGAIRRLD